MLHSSLVCVLIRFLSRQKHQSALAISPFISSLYILYAHSFLFLCFSATLSIKIKAINWHKWAMSYLRTSHTYIYILRSYRALTRILYGLLCRHLRFQHLPSAFEMVENSVSVGKAISFIISVSEKHTRLNSNTKKEFLLLFFLKIQRTKGEKNKKKLTSTCNDPKSLILSVLLIQYYIKKNR